MKSIKELAPTWAKTVEDQGKIPWVINGKHVNNDQAAIGNPQCCFVGEARGGGCYYDKLIRDCDAGINTDGSYVMIDNPEYCEQCSKMSMDFFHISEDCVGPDDFDKDKYEALCKAYEKHYNESHNGDKCKE